MDLTGELLRMGVDDAAVLRMAKDPNFLNTMKHVSDTKRREARRASSSLDDATDAKSREDEELPPPPAP